MHLHWLEGTLGAEVARLGQVEDGGGRETVLPSCEATAFGLYPCPLEPYLSFQMFFYLKDPPVTSIGV